MTSFKCECCQGTFELLDEAQAQAELAKNFPGVKMEDCIRICDDRYQKFMTPELASKFSVMKIDSTYRPRLQGIGWIQ